MAPRRFDPRGQLEWDYFRNDETSSFLDLTIEPRVVLLIRSHAETESDEVLWRAD